MYNMQPHISTQEVIISAKNVDERIIVADLYCANFAQ